jgi:hypothetical protein
MGEKKCTDFYSFGKLASTKLQSGERRWLGLAFRNAIELFLEKVAHILEPE